MANILGTVNDDFITPDFISNGVVGGRPTVGNDTISANGGNDYVNGGAGNDSIDGGSDNDSIAGDEGNDILSGNIGDDFLGSFLDSGSDLLFGGAGNDSITITGDGRDRIFGSIGIDTLSIDFFNAESGIVMTYDSVTGSGSMTATGVLTTFNGIESFNIAGSSYGDLLVSGAGNDSLFGNDGNDSIVSGLGNDSLDGGFGNDTLSGGSGDDVLGDVFFGESGSDLLFGGAGNDSITITGDGRDRIFGSIGIDTLSIDFFNAESRIVMIYDSVTGNSTVTRTDILTTASGIEAFEVSGSKFSDVLIGGKENDTLFGGFAGFGESGGNDYLNGGLGNDFLGIDGTGLDRAFGSRGVDTLYADYQNASSKITINYDPLTSNGTIVGEDILTTFNSIEAFEVSGSRFSDVLLGGIGNDTLFGGFGGNDYLNGGAGDDLLGIDGTARDRVFGGTGVDTLDAYYGNASSSISINYNLLTGDGIIAGSGTLTTFRDIEAFAVTGSRYSDTLVSSNGNDLLNGSNGNDLLNAGNGNDVLIGAGRTNLFGQNVFGLHEIDTLIGGTGSDLFVLGEGLGGAFYNDRNSSSGLGDYAVIEGFDINVDSIQLKGREFSYVLGYAPSAIGINGTGIFIDNDGIRGLSSNDELIGVLKNVILTHGSITASTDGFTFV